MRNDFNPRQITQTNCPIQFKLQMTWKMQLYLTHGVQAKIKVYPRVSSRSGKMVSLRDVSGVDKRQTNNQETRL